MPFSRPTLTTLVARVAADIVRYTDSTVALLRGSVEFALSVVQAGLSHGLHGHIQYESEQTPPREGSSLESTVQWAGLVTPDTPQIKAQGATGTATFPGTNGSVLPSGSSLSNPDGVSYRTTAEGTVTDGLVAVPILADRGGVDTNAADGTPCTLSPPVTGINSEGTYTASGGRGDETQPEVLARMRDKFRFPERGGGPGDWVRWAKEADSTNVVFAWEFGTTPFMGEVTVVIATAALGIPSTELIQTVQTYIEGVMPLQVWRVTVRAPDAQTLPLTIANEPPDGATRAAINARMLEYIQSVTVPGGTIDLTELENAGQEIDSSIDITSPVVDPNPGTFGIYNDLNITWL